MISGREWIAWRAAQELSAGDVVNLGIGMPTLIPKYIPQGMTVFLQSENGILGLGPATVPENANSDIVDAAGKPVTIIRGGAVFDSLASFGMIRGGHVDIAVLGALEVDARGMIANWLVPDKFMPGMGGGMDLAVGARKVIVAMKHTSAQGRPKILNKCSLPLTSLRAVSKVITDLAVIEVSEEGLILKELAPGVALEQVISGTEAKLQVDI